MSSGGFESLAVGAERPRLYVSNAPAGARRVVVFHPWWGLNEDVLVFVDRLAQAGFSVVAPDLVRGSTALSVEDAERLASGADQGHADAVALAAIDRLAGADGEKVGTVGFSFGAAWALWSAAQRPVVSASVVYYGTIEGPSLAKATAPVLGHFAETDPYEPDDNITGFEQALRGAGRSVTVRRYRGTSHWFAEPSRDAWRPEAAQLAFERTAAFLREHLG